MRTYRRLLLAALAAAVFAHSSDPADDAFDNDLSYLLGHVHMCETLRPCTLLNEAQTPQTFPPDRAWVEVALGGRAAAPKGRRLCALCACATRVSSQAACRLTHAEAHLLRVAAISRLQEHAPPGTSAQYIVPLAKDVVSYASTASEKAAGHVAVARAYVRGGLFEPAVVHYKVALSYAPPVPPRARNDTAVDARELALHGLASALLIASPRNHAQALFYFGEAVKWRDALNAAFAPPKTAVEVLLDLAGPGPGGAPEGGAAQHADVPLTLDEDAAAAGYLATHALSLLELGKLRSNASFFGLGKGDVPIYPGGDNTDVALGLRGEREIVVESLYRPAGMTLSQLRRYLAGSPRELDGRTRWALGDLLKRRGYDRPAQELMQSAAGAPWEGAAAMHPIGPYRDVRVALDLPSVAASARAVALKIAALDTQLRQLTPGADAFGPHTQRAPPDNGLGGMFGSKHSHFAMAAAAGAGGGAGAGAGSGAAGAGRDGAAGGGGGDPVPTGIDDGGRVGRTCGLGALGRALSPLPLLAAAAHHPEDDVAEMYAGSRAYSPPPPLLQVLSHALAGACPTLQAHIRPDLQVSDPGEIGTSFHEAKRRWKAPPPGKARGKRATRGLGRKTRVPRLCVMSGRFDASSETAAALVADVAKLRNATSGTALFDVAAAAPATASDHVTQIVSANADLTWNLPHADAHLAVRGRMADASCDAIVYFDPVLDARGFSLASARLAPVQVAYTFERWPLTTGLSAIDHYLMPVHPALPLKARYADVLQPSFSEQVVLLDGPPPTLAARYRAGDEAAGGRPEGYYTGRHVLRKSLAPIGAEPYFVLPLEGAHAWHPALDAGVAAVLRLTASVNARVVVLVEELPAHVHEEDMIANSFMFVPRPRPLSDPAVKALRRRLRAALGAASEKRVDFVRPLSRQPLDRVLRGAAAVLAAYPNGGGGAAPLYARAVGLGARVVTAPFLERVPVPVAGADVAASAGEWAALAARLALAQDVNATEAEMGLGLWPARNDAEAGTGQGSSHARQVAELVLRELGVERGVIG